MNRRDQAYVQTVYIKI